MRYSLRIKRPITKSGIQVCCQDWYWSTEIICIVGQSNRENMLRQLGTQVLPVQDKYTVGKGEEGH